MTRLADDLNVFSLICRSTLIRMFDIEQDPTDFTWKEIESFFLSMEQTTREDMDQRRSIIDVLGEIEEIRHRLSISREMFYRSVLPEESSKEDFPEEPLLSSKLVDEQFFVPIDWKGRREKIYFYSKEKSLDEKDFSVTIVDDGENLFSSTNYAFEEKFSLIYQIDHRRLINTLAGIQIGIPLFPLSDHLQHLHSSKTSPQRIFVRLRSFVFLSFFSVVDRVRLFSQNDVFNR